MFAYNLNHNLQNLKDEKYMKKAVLHLFVDNLIIENATKHIDYYSLFASDLEYNDKKAFLSYLIHIDDFADLTSNPTREREAIKEYEGEMQYLIDHRIDDLYHEIQYEMSGR